MKLHPVVTRACTMPHPHRLSPDLQATVDAKLSGEASPCGKRGRGMKTRLELLREAVDDLHLATGSFELDQRSHRLNVSKNRATADNYTRFVSCTRRVLELLPLAREEVRSNPTRATLRRLRLCERRACLLIEPYDSAGFLLRNTNH